MAHIKSTTDSSPIEGSFGELAVDPRLAEIGRAVLDESRQQGILLRFAWENVAHAEKQAGNDTLAELMLGERREILLAASLAAARG